MGMMREFKEFAVKGNVIDLAVGVIVGAAFAKIVDSVVSDLIMPIIGSVIGKVDFSGLFIVLAAVPPGSGTSLDALRKAGVDVGKKWLDGAKILGAKSVRMNSPQALGPSIRTT